MATTPIYVHGLAIASNGTGAGAVTMAEGDGGTVVGIVSVAAANRSLYVEFPGPVKVSKLHLTLSANVQEAIAYYESDTA